jgi:hypothetical protein
VEEQDGLSNALTLDNEFTHALHLPGTGSGLRVRNITVARHGAAFLASAWSAVGRGGLTTEFAGVVLKRVGQVCETDAESAQTLAQPQPSIAAFPRKRTGQLAPPGRN